MDIAEIRARLAFEPVACEIEKGMVRRFAAAVGDEGALPAAVPPAFLLTIGLDRIQSRLLDLFPGATILHGSTELECLEEVRPGDTLVVTTLASGLRERPGKMGKTSFITFDTDYSNQRKELVARCRQMVIAY